MANSKKRCKHCKKYFPASQMIKVPAGTFCTYDHAIAFANEKKAQEAKENEKWLKDFHSRISTASGRKDAKRNRDDYYEILQDLVNQWILHVRDKLEPCCTCGTPRGSRKFDAGHYRTRGAAKELRFELTNIHGQCFICNTHGSGMRSEYRAFIEAKYGADHLQWLDGPHPSLKDQFSTIEDIKKECSKFRRLIKDAGLQPRR